MTMFLGFQKPQIHGVDRVSAAAQEFTSTTDLGGFTHIVLTFHGVDGQDTMEAFFPEDATDYAHDLATAINAVNAKHAAPTIASATGLSCRLVPAEAAE